MGSRTILLSMSQGGDENNQIYRLDLDKGTVTRLTDGKSRNRLGPFRRGGGVCILTNNKRNGRDTDLYLMDPMDPSRTRMVLKVTKQFWWPAEWSPESFVARITSFRWPFKAFPSTASLVPPAPCWRIR